MFEVCHVVQLMLLAALHPPLIQRSPCDSSTARRSPTARHMRPSSSGRGSPAAADDAPAPRLGGGGPGCCRCCCFSCCCWSTSSSDSVSCGAAVLTACRQKRDQLQSAACAPPLKGSTSAQAAVESTCWKAPAVLAWESFAPSSAFSRVAFAMPGPAGVRHNLSPGVPPRGRRVSATRRSTQVDEVAYRDAVHRRLRKWRPQTDSKGEY